MTYQEHKVAIENALLAAKAACDAAVADGFSAKLEYRSSWWKNYPPKFAVDLFTELNA